MDFDPELMRKYPTFGLYFRRYAPFKTFGGANPLAPFQRFEGDDREGASTSLKVSARTYGCVMFNQYGVIYSYAGTTGTSIHLAIWGDAVAYAKVASTVVQSKLAGPALLEFTASTAGSNPLIPKVSPNIDTIVKARVDFGAPKMIRIRGEVTGDNFPNLEVFLVCYRSAHTALLIDGRTSGGRDIGPGTRLFSSHSGHSLGSILANLPLTDQGALASDFKVGPTKLHEYSNLDTGRRAAANR